MPVSMLVTVTTAPGITAPLESATVPSIDPSVPVCPKTVRDMTIAATKNFFMASPFEKLSVGRYKANVQKEAVKGFVRPLSILSGF